MRVTGKDKVSYTSTRSETLHRELGLNVGSHGTAARRKEEKASADEHGDEPKELT